MRIVGLIALLGLIASTPIHAFTASLDAFGGIVADTAYTNPSAIVSDLVDAGTGADGSDFMIAINPRSSAP